jgi:hypothetical protein
MGGMFLNLERVPPLAPKYANQIGKTATQFRVVYAGNGMQVEVASTVGTDGADINPAVWLAIPEWERRRALRNAPSNDERLNTLRRKFELRLNREFPTPGPASGSEADVQAWLATLPFGQRRALLMSQKDFSKSYPEGFRDPR